MSKKHRNRLQRGTDQRPSASEKKQEQVRKSAAELSKAQGSPADVASKHQRRFGHK